MYVHIPSILKNAEFSRLVFLLEFQDSCALTLPALLGLRQGLHQAARQVLDQESFGSLFQPQVPADPATRRLVQRPGPPFVIHPPELLPGRYEAGDTLKLPVHFWGDGRQMTTGFATVLEVMGRSGLAPDTATFELAGIEAEDAAGKRSLLWRPGQRLEAVAPPAIEASWYLETTLPAAGPVQLTFRTPGRLIAAGKPLFRASFAQLFPFLLRRVTSMLLAHCTLEVVEDARHLMAQAALAEEKLNRLHWEDWRILGDEKRFRELGGVFGAITLDGDPLGELLWVLGLAALMNVGKGASFGNGRLQLARC